MNIILWVVFGGLAGWIASIVVGTDAQTGIFWNIVIGIVGAFIGGWIADKLGVGGKPGIERPTTISNFVIAILGAIILIVILNLVF